MIDAHCHLEHMTDVDAIVREARSRMTAIVTSVPDPRDFDKTMHIRTRWPGFVCVCAGFHPEIVEKFTDEDLDAYRARLRSSAGDLVAIGEIGLDYHWITEPAQQERTVGIFSDFIDLALELGKPIVVHSRSGAGGDGITDAIDLLRSKGAQNVMMHCFSGSEANLQTCVAQGWMISFATIVVKSKRHLRMAAATPLAQLLLETDAPWLDPDTKPGSSELTNRPWKIEKSAEVIAAARGISKDDVLAAATENAARFFGLRV